jgi:HD-GYP domain-containing protein (c-di-GMP phosphodiesterase class II)
MMMTETAGQQGIFWMDKMHTNPATAMAEPAHIGAAYTCPMHPEVVRYEAGNCPVCGMALQLRSAIEARFHSDPAAAVAGVLAGRTVDAAVYSALAEALAAALDAREHETGMHSKRVACHTLVLARRFTSDETVLQQVYWGALLHDIGKIGIPDAVLLKQGALNDEEWQTMRAHPEIGHRILSSVPFMATATEIVLSHEERYDGSGYPRGLRGEEIPLWARLFAVIDTLDAMTSDRPYRKGLSYDAARTEILRMAGTQFDPVAVQAFVAEEQVLRDMVRLKCSEV